MPPTTCSGHCERDAGERRSCAKETRGSYTEGLASHLDLHQVDGLHESGLGRELAGVQNPAGRGDDLAAAAVDGVRVEGDVVDVEADGTHVLLAEHTLRRATRP